MKFLLKISLLMLFTLALNSKVKAQDTITPMCEVYGTIQGVAYDAFVKSCSTFSSDEACQDLLQQLESSFNMAVLTREDYSEVNEQGCKIVLQASENAISFSIEGSAKLMKEVHEKLKKYCVLSCSD